MLNERRKYNVDDNDSIELIKVCDRNWYMWQQNLFKHVLVGYPLWYSLFVFFEKSLQEWRHWFVNDEN